MALTLYLLRHGSTHGSGTRRYLGRTDVPLDDLGREQAALWRDAFGPGRFARCLCSPLARSLDTARMVCGHAPEPEAWSALAEIDLGRWEGLAMDDVRRDHPDLYEDRGRDLAGFRPPGGESFSDLRDRVVPVVESLLRDCGRADQDVLLAGHAGVNRVILCHALGMPLQNLFALGQDHACLSVVRFGPRGPRLERLNLPPA